MPVSHSAVTFNIQYSFLKLFDIDNFIKTSLKPNSLKFDQDIIKSFFSKMLCVHSLKVITRLAC